LICHLVAHPVRALVTKSGAIHRRPGLTDPVGADVADRAKTAIVAGSGVVDVQAEAGAVAFVVRTDVPVVRAGHPRRLVRADRRAAIPIHRVSVVALLSRIEEAIAAEPSEPNNGVVEVTDDIDMSTAGTCRYR